jgi:thioredoxin
MKKIILSFLVFINFSVFSQVIENVDAKRFKQLLESSESVILDVRTPEEFSRGHIENATSINIADREFQKKVSLLKKDKPVYVYCLSGSRSVYAAKYMAQIGFTKLYNLQNGTIDWNRNGFKLTTDNVVAKSTSTQYNSYSFDKIITTNKLVLVDFYAPWCAPCKKMSPDLEKIKTDFKGKVEVVKIDVEVNKEVSDLYNVQSVPTILLFKNGKQVWMQNRALTYQEMADKLKLEVK